MKIKRHIIALFAAIVAASASAQSVPQPLNLKLPRDSMPAESANVVPAQSNKQDSIAAAPAAVQVSDPSVKPVQMQPGVPYDDPGDLSENSEASATQKCDDSTYTQAQVHGSVGMGVVAGNHVSGNYQTGVVNASKAFGSCDHPTGGASISIGVGQGNFNGRGHGWQ